MFVVQWFEANPVANAIIRNNRFLHNARGLYVPAANPRSAFCISFVSNERLQGAINIWSCTPVWTGAIPTTQDGGYVPGVRFLFVFVYSCMVLCCQPIHYNGLCVVVDCVLPHCCDLQCRLLTMSSSSIFRTVCVVCARCCHAVCVQSKPFVDTTQICLPYLETQCAFALHSLIKCCAVHSAAML